MPTYDARTSECHVFTFKEGLLSKVAHDLKLEFKRFSIELENDSPSLRATVDPSSLQVVCVMKNGREAPGTLSERDKATVLKYTRKDVLHPERHPEISFQSTSMEPSHEGFRVTGTLTLHGVSRSIQAAVVRDGDRLTTTLEIHQPDYGIKPFSAMMGTMKVKPDVTVRIAIPMDRAWMDRIGA